MCISPCRRKNNLGEFIDYPCGKCFECVRKKKLDWEIRMTHALNWADCAFFSLLSFEDSFYPDDPYDKANNRRIIQLFIKRLRKRICHDYGDHCRIKYFIASEYGDQYKRLHFHACIFCKGFSITWREFNAILHSYKVHDFKSGNSSYFSHSRLNVALKLSSQDGCKLYDPVWPYGYVGNTYNLKMNPSKIRYTVKYIQKQYNSKYYSRFSLVDVAPEIINSFPKLDVFDRSSDLPSVDWSKVRTLSRALTCPHFGKEVPLPPWWIRILVPDSVTRLCIFTDIYNRKIPDSIEVIKRKYFEQCCFENTLI